jgi:hypothetical protein
MTRPPRSATLLLAAALVACGDGTPLAPPTPDPASRSGFTYRGVHHVSWWHDEYAWPEAAASREALAAGGANWSAVLVTWYMDRRDAHRVAPDAEKTPSDEALGRAIAELRASGVKVLLNPHVDVRDGSWRGTVDPLDAAAWFESYTAYVVRYARVAQAAGADMFSVGTELATISGARHAGRWAAVVAAVRAEYRGPLTYSANAVGPGDEYTAVSFWPLLDVAGLAAYAPLTDSTSPTVEQLERAWSRNRNGDDLVAAYRNWQRSHGRPVIFTELGYRSADGTNRAPYDFESAAAPDPGEQADCYEAAFRVWSREPWLRGIVWWNWPVPAPDATATDYDPRDKPAAAVLRAWHATGATRAEAPLR